MKKTFRQYQTEADDAIYQELSVQSKGKGIVQMFCGTGKSLLMRDCKIAQNLKLLVYVFPSLSLLKQFYEVYLLDRHYLSYPLENILKISSEQTSITPDVFCDFVSLYFCYHFKQSNN